ncbi:hypothetical protein QCE62_07035 [Caballeronia sp. LZ033]|uniref:hypothetical protein n=1 Tax=Caballeronia sp. LZ033 TaxID=3038566 RepID=UPI00285C81AD|nr:hypothetical protein [Caballeronia sp. LZ033]MDR5813346.1 hypothetical protein [Caballeronia sp. LZ033]
MTDKKIEQTLQFILVELEMQRARVDALTTALKYAVLSNPDPSATVELILKRLAQTEAQANASPESTDAYLQGLYAVLSRIENWSNDPGFPSS